MKLYFKPGACSLAPHIIAREAGLPLQLEKVDTKAGRTESGADFRAVNPKGYVPVLELDTGERLTESAVVCQYLADRAPEKKLMAAPGSLERYRQIEWLNYIATELHKGAMNPLFNPNFSDETKQIFRDGLARKLDFLSVSLEGKEHLAGDFSAPDAYAFTVLAWSRVLKFDLSKWPTVTAYLRRVGERASVRAALDAEGIVR